MHISPGRAAIGWVALAALLALALPASSRAASLTGPFVKVSPQGIQVSTQIILDEATARAIEQGLRKDISVHLGLFRVWRIWPDEFVQGVSFTRTLMCDTVKKEYTVSTLYEGQTEPARKRFSDCQGMLKWALDIPPHEIARPTYLPRSQYFIRVIAEGQTREHPQFMKLLFFFVIEPEFRIQEDSTIFTVE